MHYGDALAGDRLVGGAYEPYEVWIDEAGDLWGHSDALNLDFYWRGERFWVRDSATGEWLNFLEAELAAHEVTRAAHRREREARLAAEARARRLQAELDRARRRQ